MVADIWRKPAAVAELPEVDVSKDAHGYLLKADLPEVKKEDLTVTVQDNTLCVSGERKSEGHKRKFGRMERWYGNFRRIFRLPKDADGSKLASNLRDGVLEVHLPITAEAGPQAVKKVR
jgi:HSP20 family protein